MNISIEEKPNNFWLNLSNWAAKRGGISRNTITTSNFQYLIDKPAWLSLNNASQYRQAVVSNPVLNGCIAILAKAISNGQKYLVDLSGNEIPWSSGKTGVKNARKLFIERPNPLQSAFEFNYERVYMFFTYGNNFIYTNNPLETYDTDITTVQTLMNLPSEYVQIKQTGKLFDQVNIEGIVDGYVLTSYNPVKIFPVKNIIHFNDINTSDVGNSIIGSSRLQTLKYPITNTQLAFEAMNVILKSRGMQGIIKNSNRDAQGSQIPVRPESKKEVDTAFKEGYGIREDQNQFLIVNADIEYIKTIMNSQELGIYEEFSNNAMIISNGFGIPPELYKTYTTGATFENQIQAVRRLYQDTVIPHVNNEDLYYTERLQMRKYGFELKTKWEHIAALQENMKEQATTLTMNVNSAEKLYNSNNITLNEYRDLVGLPIVENGDLYKKDYNIDTVTLAEKIGVGGTQSLQMIISDFNMTDDQKKWALIYLFGLDETQARNLSEGKPKDNKPDEPIVQPIAEPS
jgi:phage portal protein BeeE